MSGVRRNIVVLLRCAAAVIVLQLAPDYCAWGQITRISGDLKNYWWQDSRGPVSRALVEKTYEQYYTLGLQGYVYSRKLLTFDLKTSYSDLDTDYGISVTEETRRRSDFGFYDASVTLFPENGFRLRAYARRNRINFNNSGLVVPEIGKEYASVQNNHDYGFQMYIPRNTYYPSIDVSMQRILQKCEEPCTEVYRREDLPRVTLANSNPNGSSYRAEYRGRYRDYYSEGWSSKEHQVRFRGRSPISERMDVNATGLLFLRDAYASNNINVTADYSQSTTTRHRFSMANTGTRISDTAPTRSNRTALEHRVFVDLSNELRTILGARYATQSLSVSGRMDNGDRTVLHGQMDYRSLDQEVSLFGTAGFEGGMERVIGHERRFVQSSQLGGGISYRIAQGSSILVRNDAHYEHMAIGGSYFRNQARIEIIAGVIPALPVQVRALRTDAVFAGASALPGNAVTTLEATVNWRPWYNANLQLYHAERFTRTTYTDRNSHSSATFVLYNLIRNLDLRLQADRSVSTLTGYETQRIDGELGYRLYAFVFSVKYRREAYGNYRRDRLSLEVRRPIDVRFNR